MLVAGSWSSLWLCPVDGSYLLQNIAFNFPVVKIPSVTTLLLCAQGEDVIFGIPHVTCVLFLNFHKNTNLMTCSCSSPVLGQRPKSHCCEG